MKKPVIQYTYMEEKKQEYTKEVFKDRFDYDKLEYTVDAWFTFADGTTMMGRIHDYWPVGPDNMADVLECTLYPEITPKSKLRDIYKTKERHAKTYAIPTPELLKIESVTVFDKPNRGSRPADGFCPPHIEDVFKNYKKQ